MAPGWSFSAIHFAEGQTGKLGKKFKISRVKNASAARFRTWRALSGQVICILDF